jgi:hypothetical protein
MKKYTTENMRYVRSIPRKPLLEGAVLVHNHVKPARHLGVRGFRAWTQTLDDTLEVCHCDWAGVDLHGLTHYRIKSERTQRTEELQSGGRR